MRALRNCPLFRIAVLSLAVLFAHTAHAANRPILPVAPACPGKVAAAQPDPDKKLSPAGKRLVTPGHFAGLHNLFGGSFGFTTSHAASLLPVQTSVQIAVARWAVSTTPQRSPFTLRI
jgi:hypothetical protein